MLEKKDIDLTGLELLVVEDDPTSLQLAASILRKFGATVQTASDGFNALEQLQVKQVPLIISDIGMPGMDGFELARTVRERYGDIQLIALSAHRETEFLVNAIRIGFSDYLVKPAEFEDLLWAVMKCYEDIQVRQMLKAEQAKFKAVFDCIGEGLTVKDMNFKVLHQNKVMTDMFGNAEGKFCYTLMGNDEPCSECPTMLAIADGVTHSACRLLQKEGSSHYIESTASLITDVNGTKIGTVEIIRDVSEQKRMENILKNISKGVSATIGTDFFSTLVTYLTETLDIQFAMIGELDETGNNIQMRAFCHNSTLLDTITFSVEGTPCGCALAEKLALFSGNVQETFPGLMLHGLVIESYCGARLTDSKGEAIGVLCTFHTKPYVQTSLVTDIVSIFASRASVELERLKNEKIIRDMAFHDPLTGLANRRLYEDRFEQAVAKSRRYNMSLGLIYLDLDHFKEINDRYGHDAGDKVLVEAGQRIRNCCKRDLDTICRQGGDEFCIIITDCGDKGHLQTVAERLLAEFARPFTEIDSEVTITASIGISVYPNDGTTEAELELAADKAMYAAKQAGRNRYFFAE